MGVARAVAAAGALAAGVLLVSGCGVTLHGHQYEDDNAVPQRIAKVQVAGASDLRVHVGAKSSVHRTVHYAENDPGKNTWRVQGDTLILEDCHHADCSVDYDIVVPADATITGAVGSGSVEVDGIAKVDFKASSGDATIRNISGPVNIAANSGTVTVSDVRGAVAVSAGSGEVHLSNLSGAVTANASSGSVDATGIAGPTKLEADSGDITVRMSTPQDLTAHAESGGVDVEVPHGAYQVRVAADSGEVDSAVPNDTSAQNVLDLQTDSGDISIQYA